MSFSRELPSCVSAYVDYRQSEKRLVRWRETFGDAPNFLLTSQQQHYARHRKVYLLLRRRLEERYGIFEIQAILEPMLLEAMRQKAEQEFNSFTEDLVKERLGCWSCRHWWTAIEDTNYQHWCDQFEQMPPIFMTACPSREEIDEKELDQKCQIE